ncbi:MAG: thioredoxin [Lachnospiraceae bacterium]|nr:thioredoxin [Lachnospiraceae bacterium]
MTFSAKIIRAILFITAVGLLVGGIFSDGFKDVKSKAEVVCMECIGIG